MTYQEAYNDALTYFRGDELAASVFINKYALRYGDDFKESNPDQMHRRMAIEFAKVTNMTEDEIYELFKDFRYIIPQGSIMSMLGNPYQVGSLSNCVVLPKLHDSYGGITYADSQLTALYKRRAGVGLDISPLRPSGSTVNNAALKSTGAVSFMERFSNTTREAAQAGRRGALMLTLDVRHPDIYEFVTIKNDLTKVTGANISVLLRDDFMEAVVSDSEYILRWPCDFEGDLSVTEFVRKNGFTLVLRTIRARELWDLIIKAAHANAEPGLMFIDGHWDFSPDSVYVMFKGHCTNPCGEIFMNNDSCRLMALNLFSFVDNPFTDKASFNFKKFREVAYQQQVLADAVVTLELEHVDRILAKIDADPEPIHIKRIERETWQTLRDMGAAGRRTGSGFTGLGDCLAALNIPYDHRDALTFVGEMARSKMLAELSASVDLAQNYGAFAGWDYSMEIDHDGRGTNGFYKHLFELIPEGSSLRERYIKFGRRNVSWSTVAPTGSLSILAKVTSGLEPMFQPYYMRRKKVNPSDPDVKVDFIDQNGDSWTEYPVIHAKFAEWCMAKNSGNTMEFLQTLDKNTLDGLFELSPWYNSTANDIDWQKRVELQGIIQSYTTHSISSTINLPKDVTTDEVSEIYLESWKKGLKGVTVYRDGSRTGVLVNTNTQEESFQQHDAPKRPKDLPCEAFHTVSQAEQWTVIVGLLDGKPYEVFAVRGKIGYHKEDGIVRKVSSGHYDLIYRDEDTKVWENFAQGMSSNESALSRMTSAALRHGSDIRFVVDTLNKNNEDITAFSKALARVLKKYIPDGASSTHHCMDCGSVNVIFEEGCNRCMDCGSSKCG